MTKQKHRKRRARTRAAKTGESYTSALRHVRASKREDMNVSTTETLVQCSFCGKSQKQVKKLIAGPGVYICEECIALCNDILIEEMGELPTVSVGQLLGPLPKMKDHVGLPSWVARCVRAGATWDQIAEQLGITPEEAEARFT